MVRVACVFPRGPGVAWRVYCVWSGGCAQGLSSRRHGVPGGRMTLSDASGGGSSVGSCMAGAPSPLCSWSRAGGWLEFPNAPWGAGTPSHRLRCRSWVPGEQWAAGGVRGRPGVCPGMLPVFSGCPLNQPQSCFGGRERLGGQCDLCPWRKRPWVEAAQSRPSLPALDSHFGFISSR